MPGVQPMSVIPPDDEDAETQATSFRCPAKVVARVDFITEAENKKRKNKLSRNDTLVHAVKHATKQWAKENGVKWPANLRIKEDDEG